MKSDDMLTVLVMTVLGCALAAFLLMVFVWVPNAKEARERERINRARCLETCRSHALDGDRPWEPTGECRCDVGVELRNVGE